MRARIRDLGSVGVNYDVPRHDLPPNALTDLQNVSLRDRAIRKSQGWSEAFSATGRPVTFDGWFDGQNGYALVVVEAAGEAKVYELSGGSLVDISTATGFGTGLGWDTCVSGLTGVLTNESTVPYSRTPGDVGDIAPMPNWPGTWRAPIIRPYRNFLVALKVQKGGVNNGTRVQWSNASDLNTVPPDWDELDPASLAGGFTLAGDGGPIVDGLELGQSFMIYTKTKAYSMTLTGGQYVMNVRPAFQRGLLAKNCVVAFDAGHFCVGNGVIYVTNGTSVTYMAEDKVQTRFFNELADVTNVHVAHDPKRRVIEIHYKDFRAAADGDPNTVLRWDYSDDTWSFDDLHPVGVVRAKTFPTSQRVTTWASVDTDFNKVDVAWSDIEILWKDVDITSGEPFYHMLVGDALQAATTSYIMRREDITLRDGTEYTTLIRREHIDFDQLLPQNPLATQSIKHVKRILPQITGSGKVWFRFGTANSANDNTTWSAYIEYDLDSDYKVDFRESGRYFAWEMTTRVTDPTTFRLSGFDIDVELAGER